MSTKKRKGELKRIKKNKKRSWSQQLNHSKQATGIQRANKSKNRDRNVMRTFRRYAEQLNKLRRHACGHRQVGGKT